MSITRPVVKWPPGLLADARTAAGDQKLSAYVVRRCALGIMTEAEEARVRELADALHDLAAEQIMLANRVRVLRDRGQLDEAGQAEKDLVAFAKASILVQPSDLEAVNAAAVSAGFLRSDQEQPLGNPNARNKATMARSFSAFLRAAVAAELDPRRPGLTDLAKAENALAAALEGGHA